MSHPLVRPRWILVHILVTVLVATMVFLGFWQMNRLDQKRTFNATVTERTQVPTIPIQDALAESSDVNNLEWRIVTATGRYLPDQEVTIINRSLDAIAGYSPLTPLELQDGTVVFVNRGFVLLNQQIPPMNDAEITVLGFLRKTQTRGTLGAIDSTDPSTTEFHRVDLELISQRIENTSQSMYVQLIEQSPALLSEWPAPAVLPDLDEGPHFSYAMQWWFFSLVALTGWIVVVRRALRKTTSDHLVQVDTSA